MVEVRVGDDLNAAVHRFYAGSMTASVREDAMRNDKARRKKVDKSGSSEMDGWVNGGGWGINYVAGEGVTQKRYEWASGASSSLLLNTDLLTTVRHEYLGPAPMIAGYRYLHTANQDIQILWYDTFLQDRWCEKETWDIEVEITVNPKGDAEWTMLQS